MKKWGVGLIFLLAVTSIMTKDIQLLNASCDPTRGLYEQYNKVFSTHQKQRTGDNVVIRQSRGGSGKRTTSVTDGIEVGIVTLVLVYDVDAIAEHERIDKEWIKRLPSNPAPYVSAIVFLICKDSPRQVHDWSDLIKSGVSAITPNPKGFGDARWNYLTAWGYALHRNNDDQVKVQDSVRALYKDVGVLDSGARGSANTFVGRGIDGVLIAWKDGALLAINELGRGEFEIITPSESILAEPTVPVVDKVVERKGIKEVAEAYLKYLYSPGGQEIAAKNYCCLRDIEVAKKYKNASPKLKLSTIDEELDGWAKVQKEHFANDGTFDQISKR